MTATTDNRRRSRVPDSPVRERMEELKRVISQIVLDAMNSAIPEGWEVADHAAERILSALPELGEVERLKDDLATAQEEERARCSKETHEQRVRAEHAEAAWQAATAAREAAERARDEALAKLSDAEKALEELLSGHDNLYIAHFGVASDPRNDIASKGAREVLHQLKGETPVAPKTTWLPGYDDGGE